MAIGNPDFVYNFEIVNAGKSVGHIAAQNRTVTIRQWGRDKIVVNIEAIESLELLHAEAANARQATAGMMVGALVGGPLGALVGAGAGRLMRELHCILTLSTGQAFVCTTLAKVYDDFLAHRRIIAIETEESGQLPKAKLELLLACATPVPEPSTDEPVTGIKSNVTVAAVRPAFPTQTICIPPRPKK